jgi:hypothetical protein
MIRLTEEESFPDSFRLAVLPVWMLRDSDRRQTTANGNELRDVNRQCICKKRGFGVRSLL